MRRRILIIDDEREVRDGLLEFLGDEGYETVGAETLADARQELSWMPFDLILLDLRLPDGSGLDLLAELNGPDAPPVVVVTAFPEVQTAVRALKLGAQDYINNQHHFCDLCHKVEVVSKHHGPASAVAHRLPPL